MKKVLSLALVLVLVLGMATVSFAAVGKKVDKNGERAIITIVNTATANASTKASYDNGSIETVDVPDMNPQASETDRTLWFAMNFADCDVKDNIGTTIASAVATSGGTVPTNVTFSKSDLSASKVTLKTVIKKGTAAIDTIEFDDYSSGVRMVKFLLNDTLKSNNTDGTDYEAQFYLIVDGRHWNDNVVTVAGTLVNKDDEVDSDTGYVFLGDGTIYKATEYIKSIECDLDEGVSAFAKMFKDKKYWAVADTDDNDDDNLIMDKYGFDTVYHLKNVNLAAVTDYVLLNDEDSSMYVYAVDNTKNDLYATGDGKTLKYVGKGDSKLPWADTYYLSSKQIDVEEIDEPIDDEDDFTSDVPETSEDLGGDDDYPANVNDNPGTGC